MPNKAISNLDPANDLDGSEVMPLVQDGDNVKITVEDFITQTLGLSSGIFPVVDCGEWDASGNLFPTNGGTGVLGVIKTGNEFKIVGEGTLGESPVQEEQKLILRALYDNPLQDESKWKIY